MATNFTRKTYVDYSTPVVDAQWLNGMQEKVDLVVSISDYGAIGDGVTDDSTAFLAAATQAVTVGGTLVLQGHKTYRLNTASITLPANLRMQTNGAQLICALTTTGNTIFLTIQENAAIDELKLSVLSGVRRDRVVLLNGNNITVKRITLVSIDQQANSESLDGALLIRNGARNKLGVISITNWDRPINIGNTTSTLIDRLELTSYVRGLYAYGNTNLNIGSALITARSPNALNSPGHNSVLLGREEITTTGASGTGTTATISFTDQGSAPYTVGDEIAVSTVVPSAYNGIKIVTACTSTSVSYADTATGAQTVAGYVFRIQKDCVLKDFICNDAGEHGIRIGGGPQSNMSLVRPVVYNCQGSGIKLLGTDNTAPVNLEYNSSIFIDRPLLQDTCTALAGGNAAILISRATMVTISSPTILPRLATYSTLRGIDIFASDDISITDPNIHLCYAAGISIGAFGTVSRDISRVTITGGIVRECLGDGIIVESYTGYTVRQVVVNNTKLSGNNNGCVVNDLGGGFADCILRADVLANTVNSVTGTPISWRLFMTGNDSFGSGSGSLSSIDATDGSTWSNDTTLNIRKAGSWVAL